MTERVPPETKAQQIARQIRNGIDAGKLRHGQALSSTRQLAREWKSSYNTVNAALKQLEDEGLIITRDRAGRTVNAPHQVARPSRSPVPHVVLVGGYAGSGKTEFGRILARRTGWAMLDKDSITRHVVEAALETVGLSPDDRESDVYLNVIRDAEYRSLETAIFENVECGNGVIATAPFWREMQNKAWLDRITARCVGMGATVTVAWIRCDAESMRGYLRHRGAARDTWKLTNWDQYAAGLNFNFVPPVPHRIIENSNDSAPLQDQAANLVEVITKDDDHA